MDELLQRTVGLPEIKLSPGDVVIREGEAGGGLWILVSGALQISKDGVAINAIDRPGAAVGEISLLLDSPVSATVVAREASVLRHAVDGRALMAGDAAITRLIAVGLAERLAFVTTYLADLKNQYGDAPGMAMVSEVIDQLAHHRLGPPARPGSARDPDPDY